MMDPAVALTLAAITYRGSDLNLSDSHSRELTFKEMTRCLQTFRQVRGKWDLNRSLVFSPYRTSLKRKIPRPVSNLEKTTALTEEDRQCEGCERARRRTVVTLIPKVALSRDCRPYAP
jgi:hypothetical protein